MRDKFTLKILAISIALLMLISGAMDTFTSENITAADTPFSSSSNSAVKIGVRNPAAVYCTEMGYEYKIEKAKSGERGICVMPNNEECDAWAFYRGECGREFSYCAKRGWLVATKAKKDCFATNCTTCVLPDGSRKTVSELFNLIEKCRVGMKKLDENKWLFYDTGINEKEVKGKKIALPNHFDWRNKDGGNWMTPVKDQGSCGSCWAFSAVGIVEPQYNIFYGNPNLDLDLSEEYLVSDCSSAGTCCGGWHYDALNFIKGNGITDEACFPYVDASGCTCSFDTCDTNCNYRTGGACSDATCSDRCSDWNNRLKKIDETGSVSNNIEMIKENLTAKGPLSVALRMSGYWDGDIYRCSPDSPVTHAVVIAGYNETGDYWIVKNSWGSSWNGDGYFKVGYGECSIENLVYYSNLTNGPIDKPDLVITDTWVNWPTNCTICYNITNTGKETALAGHNTTLYVDGVETAQDKVPVELAPNASYMGGSDYTWTYTPPSDDIAICADYNNTVEETNEDNNWLNVTWKCGDVNNDKAVNILDVIQAYNKAPGINEWAADVNADKAINMLDVIKIYTKSGLKCCCD